MSLPSCVTRLVAGVPGFEAALGELEAEWLPDEPPLIVSMGVVGDALVEECGDLSPRDAETILGRAESLLRDGTESEKDAAATGFIEALAAALDRRPERNWILDHLGHESRKYLAAWNQFCGVKSR